MLGAIAPDIAKMVGSPRMISHFIEDEDVVVPGIELFLSKYKKYLSNPYELGYYVHLLTDVLWFEEYLPNIADRENHVLYAKDGTPVRFSESEFSEIIYNNYTSLNAEIVSYYNMDFSLFYEKFEFPENHIKEVDEKYFQTVIAKFGDISSKNSEVSYVMNLESIVHFIEYATIYCLDEIKKIDL